MLVFSGAGKQREENQELYESSCTVSWETCDLRLHPLLLTLKWWVGGRKPHKNRLSYLELSKCTHKEQEVLSQSAKDDKQMSIDSSGAVRIRDKELRQEADLSSDLLVRQAMMRRGLALDQSNILGYLERDKWVERVFDARLETPPDGYARITHQQVINADRKLFVKLAEATRSGIQYTAAGSLSESYESPRCFAFVAAIATWQ